MSPPAKSLHNLVGDFALVGGLAGEVVETEVFDVSGLQSGAVVVGQPPGPDDACVSQRQIPGVLAMDRRCIIHRAGAPAP